MKEKLCYLILTVLLLVSCQTGNLTDPGSTTSTTLADLDFNQITFEKYFTGGAYSMAKTDDESILLVGTTYNYTNKFEPNSDILLIKIDKKLNVVWKKTFGEAVWDCGYSICKTNDNNYLICAARGDASTSNGGVAGVLIKIDKDGNKIVEKTIPSSKVFSGFDITPTSDNGFIICGIKNSCNTPSRQELFAPMNFDDEAVNLFYIKINESLDVEWQKEIKDHNGSAFFRGIETNDGGYLFSGISNIDYRSRSIFYVVKTDKSGNAIWEYKCPETISSEGISAARDVIEKDNGDIIVVGTAYSPLSSLNSTRADGAIVQLDKNGKEIKKIFVSRGENRDEFYKIIKTSDNNYLITGYVNDSNVWFYKIDSDCNLVSETSYSLPNSVGYGYDIMEFTNDNYILLGLSLPSGGGSDSAGDIDYNAYNVSLIKTDKNGNVKGDVFTVKPSENDPVDGVTGEAYDNFNKFLETLLSKEESERQDYLDREFQTYVSSNNFPIVGGKNAIFVYKGKENNVALACDTTGWKADVILQKIRGTDLFYIKKSFPEDARIDYKFVADSQYTMDSLNKYQCAGGLGVNSELRMSSYPEHSETLEKESTPKGTVEDFTIPDATDDKRIVRVYLPYGYDKNTEYKYVYFQDGVEYINLGKATTILDNLIYEKKISPAIAVFVNPIDRAEEYDFSMQDSYVDYFINKLIPEAEKKYSSTGTAKERVIVGDSDGGGISSLIYFQKSSLFKGVFLQSFSWIKRDMFKDDIFVKVYMVVGVYDTFLKGDKEFYDSNKNNPNISIYYQEFSQGHSWGLWRDTLGDGLIYLLKD